MAAYYSAMAVFYAAMAAYYTVMTALYIVMTALYIVVTAFYIVMTAFYTAMAGLHSTEHSRKLCSPKVSSPVFLLTRTDPPTLDPPNDGHQKTAHPMKDKLAIPTLLKVDSTSATMLDPITTRKEHCRFSMEETERAVTTSTLAKHKCAPAPDKLVPLTMVPAILNLYNELATSNPDYAMLHIRALLAPMPHTVPTKPCCTPMLCWTPCWTLSPAKPCCTPVPCWNPCWTLSQPSHPAHYRQGPHRGGPPQPQLPPSQGALPLLPQQGGDRERAAGGPLQLQLPPSQGALPLLKGEDRGGEEEGEEERVAPPDPDMIIPSSPAWLHNIVYMYLCTAGHGC